MSESAAEVRTGLRADGAPAAEERPAPLTTGRRAGVDYWLAIVAVVACLGALVYVRYCRPGPLPGQQVFISTAGAPPPVRWSALARPECPHCGRDVAHKADRCTHCGRCFAWCTATCPACSASDHPPALSNADHLPGVAGSVCRTCCGDGIVGND